MKKELGLFIGGMAVGALLLFLIGRQFAPINPIKTSLKISGPDGKGAVELSVEGDSVDFARIMQKIFSDEFLKHAAIGWLAEKQDIYKIDREELATAIETKLCDPIPDEPLETRLKLGKACADKVVAARLRALADRRLPPFHHVGQVGSMGLPGNQKHRPAQGFANVCKTSEFRGRKLQVSNPSNGNVVEVEATGYYECTPATRFPDIQLGVSDATTLFPGLPLQQLEKVVIVPLN